MCGINGFIYSKPEGKDNNINRLKSMNSFIKYRGPDDEGLYADEKAALGMRRLSIIDLGTGNQPIYNEDRTKLIVFNGEIYNFRELREELIQKGHAFRTRSDTEVILHGYEEYGIDWLKKLTGMFAFAIYDINSREIFIARDRAGEKPLYYLKDENRFIFASELKSILKVFEIKKSISIEALNQFLELTYIPAPLTIFEGIYKLEAGSYLIYKDDELVAKRYWDLCLNNDNNLFADFEKCKTLLREKLYASVERMMVSDVPYGAFLSGGIDSSIIVGIMSQLSKKPIETFTIGFKIKEYDESDSAKLIADKFQTNHHTHYIDYNDAIDCLEHIIGTFDEPFADSSVIPTYLVSKFASRHVKVVLTGDAGDELFGGYSKYLIGYYSSLYKRIPEFIRKSIVEKLIDYIPDNTSAVRKIKKVINNSGMDLFEQRKSLMKLGFGGSSINRLLGREYVKKNSDSFIDAIYHGIDADELTKTLYTDFKIVLEGDMLVKVDRMSMLNSIETRVPFLDRDVMELAFRLPSEFKIKGKHQKYILKEAFSDMLPKKILKKSKHGFTVPVGEWFKGDLNKPLKDMLSEDFIEGQGIFEYRFIEGLIEAHVSGLSNNYSQLWALFIFQKWYCSYFLSI